MKHEFKEATKNSGWIYCELCNLGWHKDDIRKDSECSGKAIKSEKYIIHKVSDNDEEALDMGNA